MKTKLIALEADIAQPVEPVAWLHTGDLGVKWATIGPSGSVNPVPLYAVPGATS